NYNSGSGSADIYPGSEEYGKAGYTPNYNNYTVKFTVNQDTPSGSEITFILHITDEAGNEWEDTFMVSVQKMLEY
ncbi:MAG: hypothetical protein DRJ15_15815, partial [Bacteroidetes bacterium]